jgi:hypothetical protein
VIAAVAAARAPPNKNTLRVPIGGFALSAVAAIYRIDSAHFPTDTASPK